MGLSISMDPKPWMSAKVSPDLRSLIAKLTSRRSRPLLSPPRSLLAGIPESFLITSLICSSYSLSVSGTAGADLGGKARRKGRWISMVPVCKEVRVKYFVPSSVRQEYKQEALKDVKEMTSEHQGLWKGGHKMGERTSPWVMNSMLITASSSELT